MTLAVFGKSLIIALLAGIAAWLPVAILLVSGGMDSHLLPEFLVTLLEVGLMGSYAVGLPIALLTFQLSGKELAHRRSSVFIAANLGAVVMVLVTALLGGWFGIWLFGLPCVIAANVYALLGWFWIIRPMRNAPQ